MNLPHITLFIPALFDGISRLRQSIPRFTALETLLARADRKTLPAASYYRRASDMFDTHYDADAIPVAAVSRYADSGHIDDKVWMHADPVYLEADKDRLLVRGRHMLDLEKVEVEALLQELNVLYADDGFYFEAFDTHRWYVRLPRSPDCSFYDLSEALGRSVQPYLPTGTEQTHWHRFMNEVQMLLHASETNQQRAQCHQYPVNSVWCWGPGRVPAQVKSDWHAVYTQEPFVKGLATMAGVPVYPVPPSLEKVLQNAHTLETAGEQRLLVVIAPGEEDILSDDINHHIDRLLKLEKDWFEPLVQSLKHKRVGSINLLACDRVNVQLNRHHLRRFWRKRKKISAD